jgi:probable F420-dependent oxidoreductase
MRLGLNLFLTDRSITPAELAREAEARGFSSLWVPEHTHIPTSRITRAPAGEPLAEEYKRTLDPFVALATAAAVTTDLRLGTGIALLAQRDAIVTAKEVASLDVLSGGRFSLGIGYGWNIEELADHGVTKKDRRAVVREATLAMEALWDESIDEPSFSGEFVNVSPSFAWPKPVQQPRPPVLIGGAPGPTLFEHIAEFADGWIPIGGGGVAAALPDLRAAFERAGRDPAEIEVIPFGVLPNREKLDHYAELGIEECVLQLPSADASTVLAKLDEYAPLL